MSQQDTVDRVVASLHEAMLGESNWSEAAPLIEQAFGAKGTHLLIVDGHASARRQPVAPEWLFDRLHLRGELRLDFAQLYFEDYFPHDERIPRVMRLPDRCVMPVTRVFTEREMKTSPTYNEALLMSDCQDSLNVRMDGPDGLDILMGIADPVAPDGWSAESVDTIEHILVHVRQFIRVRHALARAEALGTSLTGLLANAMVGVIYLDRQGKIVEANSRAREILRQGDGLSDRDGLLHARLADDDAKLGKLVADSLPGGGRQAVSGSMTVERSLLLPRLVVHVNPVASRQLDFGARRVAALVLIVDPGSSPTIDAGLVAATFRLTRAESQVAAALAEGSTVQEIAVATFRAESSVRWLVKQIHAKLGISRQADLVRMVLAAAGGTMPKP